MNIPIDKKGVIHLPLSIIISSITALVMVLAPIAYQIKATAALQAEVQQLKEFSPETMNARINELSVRVAVTDERTRTMGVKIDEIYTLVIKSKDKSDDSNR